MRFRCRFANAIPSRNGRGFSLLELVTVLWALTFVILVGVTTLLGAVKIEQAATASFNRQNTRNRLADQFRTDVALATSAPDKFGECSASTAFLILQLTPGNYVLYRWEAGRMERAELKDAADSPNWISLGGHFGGAEFSRSAGGLLLTLRLTESTNSPARNRSTEIAAALGGDRR